jgi:hypothetical protein
MANPAILPSLMSAWLLAGCLAEGPKTEETPEVTSSCPEPDIDPGTYVFVHASNGTHGIEGVAVTIENPSAPTQHKLTPWYGCAIFQVEPGHWSGIATYEGQEDRFVADVGEREIENVIVVFDTGDQPRKSSRHAAP